MPMPIWLTCIPPRMYHGSVEEVGITSFAMDGDGVASVSTSFVGVVRPEVVVESTL